MARRARKGNHDAVAELMRKRAAEAAADKIRRVNAYARVFAENFVSVMFPGNIEGDAE